MILIHQNNQLNFFDSANNIIYKLTTRQKMYQDLSKDALDAIIKQAEIHVMHNDRDLYKPYLEEMEKFCIEKGVFIGGKVGVDLLLGREFGINSFNWELYCDNTYQIARELADRLATVENKYVNSALISLRTDLKHVEFTIMINTRQMIKIYALRDYRGFKLKALMGGVHRTGYLTREQVLCMPEEIALIEIYRGLYSPKRLDKWEEYLETENQLFGIIEANILEKATKPVEKPSAIPKSAADVRGGANDSRRSNDLDACIIENVIKSSNNVLVGDYALQYIAPDVAAALPQKRIHMITDTPIEELANQFQRALSRNIPRMRKVTTIHITYPLNIPSDFQITKNTIYAVISSGGSNGSDQIPLADVYNSSAFELIPVWEVEGIRLGNPWVILRFRFIELWVLKLISNLGNDGGFIRAKISAVVESIKDFHIMTRNMLKSEPSRLFQLDSYVGVYINDVVAKKKLIAAGEKFAPYYPARDRLIEQYS